MQHMTATDGIAVDHRDDRLGQTAYLHLHIEHAEARHTLSVDIAATTFHMHVATGAESLVASTCEQHDTNVQAVTAIVERLRHLPRRERGERIAIAFAVDGDLRNVMPLFKKDLLEVESFNLFPVSFHIVNYQLSIINLGRSPQNILSARAYPRPSR